MAAYREDAMQRAIANYLDYNNAVWCHVANERGTTRKTGAHLKAKGVKPGVPDVLIFHPSKCGKFNGLAIELKVKPNKPTENQFKWMRDLDNVGWKVGLCYTLDEALNMVNIHLGIK